MSSRRHREHTSSSRKDRYRPRSPGENDPDRARQSVSAAQRYAVDPTSTAHDRLHRSVRRHDVADALASLHTKSAAKDPSTHQQPITSQHILTQSQNQSLHPVVPLTVSTQPHLPSSRQPAQDTQRDAYSIRTKKSEKRSPPSSDEKILVGDQTKPSRSTQQPRTGYPVPDGAVSAPATTQAFWIPPAPSARDATSSSKRREKEKGREKEKERKEREREKSRQREEQRMKDRADEAVRERELRREEEERARDRRRKERGRSERRATDLSKDPESRRRDESQGVDPSAPRSSQFPSISRARAKHFTLDERVLSRPQDPSGPPTPSIVPVQHSAVSAQNYVSSRVPVSSAPRREDYPPTSRVPQSTPADHDKRRHRSNRDRTGGHQSAQESGMSSSEQEHSGRERSLRTSDRRHLARDYLLDTNHSGPSGSENERASTRSRRKYSRVDPYASDPTTQSRTAAIATLELNKSVDSRHPVNAPPYSSAPTGAQATSPLVGSTPFTHTPHIVRIRAGQGPPDPQTPISHARTPLGAGMSVRPHEHGTSEAPPRPSTIQPILEYDMVAHSRMQNPPAHPHSQQSVGVTSQPTQHAHPVQPVRPPSTAPHAPTSSHPAAYTTLPAGLSRSQAAPSPAIHPPALPPKGPINFTKQVEMHIQANSSMSAAHFAKLSVYRAPDPPVSAHLVVPTVHGIPPSFTIHGSQSSDAHRSKLTAQDLSSKFPLNEDALASALTNAHSTARLAGTHPSSSTSQHHSRTAIVPEGMGNASQHGAQPPRSSTYPPPASSGNAFAPHAPSSSSPLRHQLPNPVDDTTPKANPLPIPEPKTPNMSTSQQQPVQAMQAGQAYDPRSPKQNLTTPAPIISSSPYQSSRLPVSPVQSKQPSPLPTPYPLGHSLADSAIASALPSRSVHPGIPPGPYQPSAHNYSPPRNAQYNQLRSPVVPNASSLAPATPKQSPSGRLHVRNGSNDTITQLPTSKPSPPKNPQNSLVQPSSIINLNSNVASRPDTIPIVARPSTSPGYPEPARYRSPPPTQYPFGSSSQQQHALHALPPNAVPYNPSLPSGTVPHLHSRSASHPVPSVLSVQVPSHDATANMQRGQSTPSVPVASTPSAASAIATAYRQQVEPGMRWSDMPTSATGSLSNQQRVPPRAVPSPAPTINGRSYPGMAPSAGPTSSTTPMNGPRPSRGHSVPAPARPATAQPSTIHSRSVSDPQNALQQSRVAVSGHPSTPSPTKGHLVPSSGAPEAELLKTPSSLAPSMLPPVIKVPLVSSSHVKEKTKEKEKVKEKERESRRRTGGFFGLFRSRSSPPKEPEVRPPVNPKPTGRPRASSHSTITAVAASMKNIVTPHPTHVYAPPPKPAPVPMPIVAPTPVPAAAMMEPGGKMYSPFRLLSKRNRTVSSASVEAQDGTAANTIIGGESTRSSTAGRLSPPLRDPGIATIDWRNQEEAVFRERGTLRRFRPGVTFDVEDDASAPQVSRPTRRPSRRGS